MVTFRITGTALVDRFRDQVLSGRWQSALEDFREALDISYDAAINILRGEMTLTSDFEYVSEDAEVKKDYQEEVDGVYGNTIFHHGCWITPYAVVTDFGPADEAPVSYRRPRIDRKRISEDYSAFDREKVKEWMCLRAINGYSSDPRHDTAHVLSCEVEINGTRIRSENVILFRPAESPPPFWLHVPRSLQETVDRAEERGELREIGHKLCFGVASPNLEPNRSGWLLRPTADLAPLACDQSAVEDRKERARDATEAERRLQDALEEAKQKIIEHATFDHGPYSGWMQLSYQDNDKTVSISIPKAPFVKWSLRRTSIPDPVDWKPQSPPSAKIENDDRFHTDWMLGAGLDLQSWYSRDFPESFFDAIFEAQRQIQRELGGFEVVVLFGTGQITGTVVHPEPDDLLPEGTIAVIPSASPEYQLIALQAALVITESGGPLAHLVTVARESEKFGIIRVSNARKEFPIGAKLTVDLAKGQLSIQSAPATKKLSR